MASKKYIKLLDQSLNHHDYQWTMGRNDEPNDHRPIKYSQHGFYVCEPKHFFVWMSDESSFAYVAYADIPDDAEKLELEVNVKASSIILYEPLIPLHEFIPEAIKAGADLHIWNDLPLRSAANYGKLDVVKCLVEQGADVNARDGQALRNAAHLGHFELVKYLLDHGADIHAKKDDSLVWACYGGHLEIVKYLLDHGADIHAQNEKALAWALERGRTEVVKYLLERGADPSCVKK